MSLVKDGERSRFVLHSEKSLVPLRWWLKDRKFNGHFPYLVDSRGNRMVGINWHFRDDRGHECVKPCGLILIRDEALADQVIKMVEEHMQPRHG
jgi:hypothetical protein